MGNAQIAFIAVCIASQKSRIASPVMLGSHDQSKLKIYSKAHGSEVEDSISK
jgi:hypothetical protein